jgi:GR25 family glycosyltransferase involved in LPS biosynthesis
MENEFINFNINDDYLFDIKIINLSSRSELFNISDSYDNIIICINSLKLNNKFIKITKDQLLNNEYDFIQLQYNADLDEFNKNIRSSNIFNTEISDESDVFLLKNNTLSKIIEGKTDDIKYAKLNKPIFINSLDINWYYYYNFINSLDKVYCLHLNKDYNRLNAMIEICNMLNQTPSKFFYDGILGYFLPSSDNLITYNISKIKLKTGEAGCILSQQLIFEDAQINKYKKILILEDDVYFNNDFFSLFYNITNKVEYDFLNLGPTINSQINYKSINKYKNVELCKLIPNEEFNGPLNWVGGAFALLVNNKFIDLYLNLNKPIIEISDVLCNNIILEKYPNNLKAYILLTDNKENNRPIGLAYVKNYIKVSNTINLDNEIN